MNEFKGYAKRLTWFTAVALTAFVAGCGGGDDGGGGGGNRPGAQAGPAKVDFGAASTFGAGSGTGLSNQGTATVVNGNIGTTGNAQDITGFHDASGAPPYSETAANVGNVTGTIYSSTTPAADAGATGAAVATALQTAQGKMNDMTGGTDPSTGGTGELGGLTLAPGVYAGTFQITNGDLTLNAAGDPNAFWVFQTQSLLVGDTSPRNVILTGGALAKNVYWNVVDTATINTVGGGTMVGTILAPGGVKISSANATAPTTLDGRAFAFAGTVDMVNTIINVPAP